LDFRSVGKGKYEFLLSWKGSSVANDTWVAESRIPDSVKAHLETFKLLHHKVFGVVKGVKKSKLKGLI